MSTPPPVNPQVQAHQSRHTRFGLRPAEQSTRLRPSTTVPEEGLGPINEEVKSIFSSVVAQDIHLSPVRQKQGLLAIIDTTVDPLLPDIKSAILKGVVVQRSKLKATTNIAEARLDPDDRTEVRRFRTAERRAKHISYLNTEWIGPGWIPEDVRRRRRNQQRQIADGLISRLVTITKIAKRRGIILSSLWLQGGLLRELVGDKPLDKQLFSEAIRTLTDQNRSNSVCSSVNGGADDQDDSDMMEPDESRLITPQQVSRDESDGHVAGEMDDALFASDHGQDMFPPLFDQASSPSLESPRGPPSLRLSPSSPAPFNDTTELSIRNTNLPVPLHNKEVFTEHDASFRFARAKPANRTNHYLPPASRPTSTPAQTTSAQCGSKAHADCVNALESDKWLSSSHISLCLQASGVVPPPNWHVFDPGFPVDYGPGDQRKSTVNPAKLPDNLVLIIQLQGYQHWSVGHLSRQAKVFRYFDSLPKPDVFQNVQTKIASWIADNRLVDTADAPLEFSQEPCARQTDAYNCGIFAIEVVVALLAQRPIPPRINPSISRAKYAQLVGNMHQPAHCNDDQASDDQASTDDIIMVRQNDDRDNTDDSGSGAAKVLELESIRAPPSGFNNPVEPAPLELLRRSPRKSPLEPASEQLVHPVANTPVDGAKTFLDKNGHASISTPVPCHVLTQPPDARMEYDLPAGAVETAVITATQPRDKRTNSSAAAVALLTDIAPDFVNHIMAAASLRPSVAAKLQAEKDTIARDLSRVQHLQETHDTSEQICTRYAETGREIQRLDLEKTKHDTDIRTLRSMATNTNGIVTESLSAPLRVTIQASYNSWMAQAQCKAASLERRLGVARDEYESLGRLLQYRKTVDEEWSTLKRREDEISHTLMLLDGFCWPPAQKRGTASPGSA
ncbi:hypothetical protein LY76DRAFT_599386 [Colletotrichum caudatum]|nr:hypothetical protein LY76DRAFT_599386 [Colletotrichum caudatum]